MIDEKTENRSREIITKAKTLGADLAGIARVEDLKQSPSHRISKKMPTYDGVGTKTIEGRQHGIVQWPHGAKSAVVIIIAHPPAMPELDWWVTGSSAGNTAGNRLLITVVKKLADWLEQTSGIRSFKLPYHIEHGGIYMKDAAVMAGLGCVGKNNLLITPDYGPRQRLRVMLIDAELPSSGPIEYDPCFRCPMPCRKACPQGAFSKTIYNKNEYGMDELPGRNGSYSRFRCNRQMDINSANFDVVEIAGQAAPGKSVKYCRECELACPAGTI